MLNDPHQARILAEIMEAEEDTSREKQEWTPPLAEFDLHARLLRDVIESINGLHGTFIAANSKRKPKSRPPYPVPETAIERHRKQIRLEQAEGLIAELLPGLE